MAGTLIAGALSTGTKTLNMDNMVNATAKAWVNFDGTGPSILQAMNVSSITDLALGKYQVNFTTPMESTNYTFAGCGRATSAHNFACLVDQGYNDIKTVSGFAIRCQVNGSGQIFYDPTDVGIIVFG